MQGGDVLTVFFFFCVLGSSDVLKKLPGWETTLLGGLSSQRCPGPNGRSLKCLSSTQTSSLCPCNPGGRGQLSSACIIQGRGPEPGTIPVAQSPQIIQASQPSTVSLPAFRKLQERQGCSFPPLVLCLRTSLGRPHVALHGGLACRPSVTAPHPGACVMTVYCQAL